MSKQKLNRAVRHSRKRNRLGLGARCELCGEEDIRALQRVGKRVLCAECRLEHRGKPPIQYHHPPGKANDDFTIPVPANDHCNLSDSQYDWPWETLRNPEKDPLRQMAAWDRGTHDLLLHIAEKRLDWALELEKLSKFLVAMYGPDWVSSIKNWGDEDESA